MKKSDKLYKELANAKPLYIYDKKYFEELSKIKEKSPTFYYDKERCEFVISKKEVSDE
jgi:hypothetical protein